MKIAHKKLWGRVDEIIAMVQKARDEGHDVTANVYPYTAGQNNLSSIIPPWAHDGGREKMLERLHDPAARKRMHDEVLNGLPDWYNHYLATGDGWAGMILVSLQRDREQAVPGQAHERADRGARRRSGRCAVRPPDRGERQRPDRVLPSLRAGHAARAEAAVDVDRIGRLGGQSGGPDRPVAPASRATTARSRACSAATCGSCRSSRCRRPSRR